MSMVATAQINGFREANRNLNKLRERVAKNGTDRALKKAASPIRRKMRQKAKKGKTGNLRKGIKIVIQKEGSTRVAVVGAFAPAFHAHLIEYGSEPHDIELKRKQAFKSVVDAGADLGFAAEDVFFSGTIKHPGSRAQPFIRPAYDEEKDNSIKIYGEVLGDFIEAEADKITSRIASGKIKI